MSKLLRDCLDIEEASNNTQIRDIQVINFTVVLLLFCREGCCGSWLRCLSVNLIPGRAVQSLQVGLLAPHMFEFATNPRPTSFDFGDCGGPFSITLISEYWLASTLTILNYSQNTVIQARCSMMAIPSRLRIYLACFIRYIWSQQESSAANRFNPLPL